MKKILVLSMLSCLLMTNIALSQKIPGYKIQVTIPQLADTNVYLGYYYGKWQYIKDTIKLDKTGKGIFQSKDTVGSGMYLLITPSKKYLEFILNDNERIFSIETDTTDLLGKAKVKGSLENELFFKFNNEITKPSKEIYSLQQKVKEFKQKNLSDSVEFYNSQIKLLIDSINNMKIKYMEQYPTTLLARMFKATKEPEVPDKLPLKADGSVDSSYKYYYFKDHYWDNINIADEALLRTPIYHNKLETYFNNVIVQHPDTIIKEIDKILAKAAANKETFKYVLWWLTYNYETSKVMGFDKIFVYLADNYYKTGKAYWLSESSTQKIIERADAIRPNLLGNIAPNLILLDTAKNLNSLHNINAKYTILYFWDPSCGHCKKETPKLAEFYKQYKDTFNLKVFAVCTDSSFIEMKKAINNMQMQDFINVNGIYTASGDFRKYYDVYSTPVLYVLDQYKRIIGKRLVPDQLYDFLKNYEKHPLFPEPPEQSKEPYIPLMPGGSFNE